MELRLFKPSDLPDIYEICLRTGDAGGDATESASDPRLLGDYFAAPYTVHDPSLCLVLEDEAGACGYILGTADTRPFLDWFNSTWLPLLRARHGGLRPRTGASDGWLIDRLQEDVPVPACAGDYPAHLHIDLLPRAQGKGQGRRMFEAWNLIAASRGASGVHLGVASRNTGAILFYERVGMHRIPNDYGATLFGLRLA